MLFLVVADRPTTEALTSVLDRVGIQFHAPPQGTRDLSRVPGEIGAAIIQWSYVPDPTGFLDELQRRGHGRRVHVLGIIAPDEDPSIALVAGADDFLVAPLRESELLARIFIARNTITSWTLSHAVEEKVELADAVLSNIEGIVLAANAQGEIVYVSASCQSVLGYIPGQLMGDGWWTLAIRDEARLARAREYFAAAIADPATIKQEPFVGKVIDVRGEQHWFLWHDALSSDGTLVIGIGQQATRRVEAERAVRQSERKLRAIIDNSTVPMYVKDQQGRYRIANPAAAAVFKMTVEEFEGRGDHELLGPETATVLRSIDQAIIANGRSETYTSHRRFPTGERWFLTTKTPVEVPGIGLALVGIAVDISDRIQAEQALRESENRYALAAEGSRDGIWDLDLNNDELYLSTRWKRMIGYRPDEFPNDFAAWLDQIHPRDRHVLSSAIASHLHGETEHVQAIYRIRTRDRSYRWVMTRGVVFRDEHGVPHRLAGSQTDIHDRKTNDPLTELANETRLRSQVERELNRAAGKGAVHAHLFHIGLNRFASINESLGYNAGDHLLQQVARRLTRLVSPRATVARIGGDQFAVLEEVADQEQARELGERLFEALGTHMLWDGEQVFLSASIGIVPLLPTYRGMEDELLSNAETAYRQARDRAGTKLAYFSAPMQDRAVRSWRVRTALFTAIEDEQLGVYLQPIVRLDDRRVVGFEALLRWQHPELGEVSPAEFIPIAEETGQIIPIGRWVIEAVCELLAKGVADVGGLDAYISVNLSGRQLGDTELCAVFREAAARAGVDPQRVRFEVTETALLEDFAVARRTLEQLHALGSAIMLDDFGTGYSSLSYLNALPLQGLKLDRSFIANEGPAARSALVDAVIQFAARLSLDVVAEGIETREQARALARIGCRYGQGYLFARPAPPAEIGPRPARASEGAPA